MAEPEGTFVNYYELLGLRPGVDIGQIRNAFLQKAKQHHPDAGGSTEAMQQLNAAYKTLMNSTSKAAYDMLHNFHTGETQIADYKYEGGRSVQGVQDMTDDEIDSFLDSVFTEYRHGVPKPKTTLSQRLKQFLKV